MRIPDSLDYKAFLREFSGGLKSVKGVSFFIFGSYLRQDFVPGVSDLNGFLVLNDSFITNKNLIKSLAGILSDSLKKSNVRIKTKFNVLDKGIASDGRFLVYSKDYVDFLKKNAVAKFGGYNLEDMKGSDYINPEQISISTNLNDIRKGFFYDEFNHYSNKRDFYDDVIRKLSRLPKQLINLSENKLIENKDKSLDVFLKKFPKYVNSSTINTVNSLMKDPEKYESFLESHSCFSFSLECLGEMEKMIKVYVEQFPNTKENEVKDILSN